MQIHYLPNIAYFQELVQSSEFTFHLNDKYSRRTNRNRTEIVGPNGRQLLTIPTLKLDPNKRNYDNIRLSYSESWLKQHWKSFESAYRRSVYFEYYEDKFKGMYEAPKFEYLWEFNFELIKICLNALKLNGEITLNRELPAPVVNSYTLKKHIDYQQVFSNKLAFEPNLSIIDLIFNLGPQANKYL